MSKKKSITYKAIEDAEWNHIENGMACIALVPVGPAHLRASKFGFMCKSNFLRKMGRAFMDWADKIDEAVGKNE